MDGIGEYSECPVVDTKQVVVLQYGGVCKVPTASHLKILHQETLRKPSDLD